MSRKWQLNSFFHFAVLCCFQLCHNSRCYQRGEPERRPQVLLHEPVWEVPGQATPALETRGADSQNCHDHYTSMFPWQHVFSGISERSWWWCFVWSFTWGGVLHNIWDGLFLSNGRWRNQWTPPMYLNTAPLAAWCSEEKRSIQLSLQAAKIKSRHKSHLEHEVRRCMWSLKCWEDRVHISVVNRNDR